MFDIGWLELLLIGIVALIVVGPKELPGMFRTFGRMMGKARTMAREFQRSMEQAADDTGLNDAARGLRSLDKMNLNSATKSAKDYAKRSIDPNRAKARPTPGKAKAAATAEGPAPGDAEGETRAAPAAPASPEGTRPPASEPQPATDPAPARETAPEAETGQPQDRTPS